MIIIFNLKNFTIKRLFKEQKNKIKIKNYIKLKVIKLAIY